MKLEINLARQAIKLSEFQEFMISEMRISNEELEKLKACGNCWKNFSFTERSIIKINEQLFSLSDIKKIQKINRVKTQRFQTKNEAINYIKSLKIFDVIFISH